MISECLLLVILVTFVAAFWQPAICSSGYTGNTCQQRCPYPKYGGGCKQRCRCKPDICSHIKGCHLTDRCSVGFTGKYCEKQCSYPRYGFGCQKSCSCSKQQCNASTGCQFTKTVNKNQKSHQMNPFSTAKSYPHTTKIVDDISPNAGQVNKDRTTAIFVNAYFTEQIQISDELKSNANLYFLLRESKWVLLCFVLFGIMLFLLSIAHIVLSIIQCRSENRI